MSEPVQGAHLERDAAFEGKLHRVSFVVMTVFFVVAPAMIYPVFLMKALCFGLFACAFNLLIGYGGLLSFGHAMFLGMAGFGAAHPAEGLGFPPALPLVSGVSRAARRSCLARLSAVPRQC